jgi:hypothetical protein
MRVQIANSRNGFVDCFAGNKAGGEFLEKAELRGKLFQPFLSGQVNQRASRYHCSVMIVRYDILASSSKPLNS